MSYTLRKSATVVEDHNITASSSSSSTQQQQQQQQMVMLLLEQLNAADKYVPGGAHQHAMITSSRTELVHSNKEPLAYHDKSKHKRSSAAATVASENSVEGTVNKFALSRTLTELRMERRGVEIEKELLKKKLQRDLNLMSVNGYYHHNHNNQPSSDNMLAKMERKEQIEANMKKFFDAHNHFHKNTTNTNNSQEPPPPPPPAAPAETSARTDETTNSNQQTNQRRAKAMINHYDFYNEMLFDPMLSKHHQTHDSPVKSNFLDFYLSNKGLTQINTARSGNQQQQQQAQAKTTPRTFFSHQTSTSDQQPQQQLLVVDTLQANNNNNNANNAATTTNTVLVAKLDTASVVHMNDAKKRSRIERARAKIHEHGACRSERHNLNKMTILQPFEDTKILINIDKAPTQLISNMLTSSSNMQQLQQQTHNNNNQSASAMPRYIIPSMPTFSYFTKKRKAKQPPAASSSSFSSRTAAAAAAAAGGGAGGAGGGGGGGGMAVAKTPATRLEERESTARYIRANSSRKNNSRNSMFGYESLASLNQFARDSSAYAAAAAAAHHHHQHMRL